MGVPKFFRFISGRYPCINKIIKEHEIPQYDNLYFDMNSIIHTCSHPTDSDVHFRIGKKEFTDEDIFQNVSRYVEIIVRIVKPAEHVFLAFDGVAPRAKMNQQRANRFRVARNINKSNIEGELQCDGIFDANCITPGTVFMNELIDYMKHFIAFKVSTDPLWQKCKIILSGSEVPGEGEHKIMQFIRYNKAQPNYNQNTRHCLYSLDADLIMLGLCTHEPHFSLLRENVTFGKTKKMLTPEESDFQLLHLSLVREYLEYEFASIKSNLKFDFDLEKIIDDWVLIEFLVGNDFIPQLPHLHIVNGALPLLYQVYIKVLPTLDGYINEAGSLNLYRFEKLMKYLSYIEIKMFQSTELIEACNLGEAQVDIVKKDFEKLDIKSSNEDNLDSSKVFNLNKKETKEESNSTNSYFHSHKEKYYKNKLKFNNANESLVHTLVEQYIRAIQWTLSYYYHGCSSWSWYYPYHYAPLISDIKNLQNISFKFDMAKPFLPLQHLLAVLPPANCHLLPTPLHFLLTNSKSPIIDYYPEEFEIDQNGKSNDWEAIVLIPFIDEKKLINAMEPFMSRLNAKERKRNTNGLTCIYTYTKTSLGQYPVDTVFDSFVNHAQLEYIKPEDIFILKDKLVTGLCRNVRFDLSISGFPTLKYIPHSFEFEMIETKTICNRSSTVQTMVLNVSPKLRKSLEQIAKDLLGQSVYINWPHLQEAYVIGVTDFTDRIFLQNFWKKYSVDNLKIDKLPEQVTLNLKSKKALITELYKKSFGINIGKTEILVCVFPIMGKRYVCGNLGKVQLQTKWSSLSTMFPYQLIVKEEQLHRVTFLLYKSITDIFVASNSCFMIGHPNYGSIGQIKHVLLRQQRVAVELKVTSEPDFASTDVNFFTSNADYMSCSSVAKKLKVSSIIISRITGSLIVIEGSTQSDGSKYYDIGLRMKFPKQDKELFEYTKKKNDSWFYSSKAAQVIQMYIETFPELFANINKNPTSSTFTVSELFPEGLNKVNLVKNWLVEQESCYTTFLECGTKTLGFEGVPKLEKFLFDFLSNQQESTIVETEVSPQVLYRPGVIIGLVPADIKAQHKLLDRIICIRDNFTVPLGLKGTIIGIQEKEDKWKNVYEVLFDSSFVGGLTLYESSEHKCYRLTVADFVNISFGQRATCTSSARSAPKQSAIANAPKETHQTNIKNKPAEIPVNVSNNVKMKPLKTVAEMMNDSSNNKNKTRPPKMTQTMNASSSSINRNRLPKNTPVTKDPKSSQNRNTSRNANIKKKSFMPQHDKT